MVLIVNQENQESQESKKKERLSLMEMKSQKIKDLPVIQDLVAARITKLLLTETKKESKDPLVSRERLVKDKKAKLKDIVDHPANQDSHVVATRDKLKVTLDLIVSQDSPVVAMKAKMRVTPDPLVNLDSLEVDRMVKMTGRTLNPKDLQESTKMEKSEAMTEVPTDVPEDPVVRVVEVAAVKVAKDPMVNSVAEEETATAVVDLVPKAIVQSGASPATIARKKDTSPETALPHQPLLSEINESVY